jgi:hypothetical protein
MIFFGLQGLKHCVSTVITPLLTMAAGFVSATRMKRVIMLYGLPMNSQNG